ncbi:helix-turn-helix domain-containing protein [Paraburkholderia sp. LEh10]|uniref:helix-turn-helix domain-containing protein n=1 Tax=Paraburkholderia sp. LEh10 TaxID=2821353 RepID=UPI00391823C6
MSWNLGQVELLCVELAHQSLSPIAELSEPYLFVKLIETGSMVLEQNGQVRRFEAGSMVLVDPAKPYRQIFAERAQMIAVRIPKSALKERGFRHDLRGLVVPDIATSDVRAIGDVISGVARQNGSTSTNMRRRQGEQLLDLVDILIEDPSALIRSRSGDATLFRAKRFIAQNLRNADLTATLIASAVNASEAHLNRLFKTEGSSLMRYVWSRRLELAANLLERCVERSIQVSEIAYRCGFSTPAHFSRAFKARYGMTPRDAIERRREQFQRIGPTND